MIFCVRTCWPVLDPQLKMRKSTLMSALNFAREFVTANDPDEVLPDYVDETSEVSDHQNESLELDNDESKQDALEEVARPELVECDEPTTEFDVLVGTVRVFAEDCGGNLALPNYGFSRPLSDYYNRNLMLHSFIQCDGNNIAHFDESGQRKGADDV